MTTRRDSSEQARRKRVTDDGWANEKSGGYEPTAVRRPDDLPLQKLDQETLIFDVIPFILGEGNPRGDAGYEYWQREYFSHPVPTPDGPPKHICCLYAMWGEDCKLCRFANQQRDRPQAADEPGVFKRDRHLLLVNNVTKYVLDAQRANRRLKDPPPLELRLLDVPHKNRGLGFGEQLKVTINANEGLKDTWWLLAGGCHLRLTVKNTTYGQISRMDLVPRPYDYPEDLSSQVPCLDDMIIKPTPEKIEEMMQLLTGGVSDDVQPPPSEHGEARRRDDRGDREDRPARRPEPVAPQGRNGDRGHRDEAPSRTPPRRGKEPTAMDLDIAKGDFVTHPKYGECEVVSVSEDGTTLVLKNQQERLCRDVIPADCEVVPLAGTKPAREEEPRRGGESRTQSRNPPRGRPAQDDEPEEEDDDFGDDPEPDDGEPEDDADADPEPRGGRGRR